MKRHVDSHINGMTMATASCFVRNLRLAQNVSVVDGSSQTPNRSNGYESTVGRQEQCHAGRERTKYAKRYILRMIRFAKLSDFLSTNMHLAVVNVLNWTGWQIRVVQWHTHPISVKGRVSQFQIPVCHGNVFVDILDIALSIDRKTVRTSDLYNSKFLL